MILSVEFYTVIFKRVKKEKIICLILLKKVKEPGKKLRCAEISLFMSHKNEGYWLSYFVIYVTLLEK